MTTYSVSFRLRRVSVEERYVSVPVDRTMMRTQPEEDGSFRLDTDKLVAAAIELGQDDSAWLPEEREVTLHPIQQAPDDVQASPDAE